jgi:oxaloacetate decarboxylase gamma subunit
MTISALMMEGLGLLVAGMGIVFGFLILLVFAMKGMSRLAFALGGKAVEPAAAAPVTGPARDDGHLELTAVISAAVARYRKGTG